MLRTYIVRFSSWFFLPSPHCTSFSTHGTFLLWHNFWERQQIFCTLKAVLGRLVRSTLGSTLNKDMVKFLDFQIMYTWFESPEFAFVFLVVELVCYVKLWWCTIVDTKQRNSFCQEKRWADNTFLFFQKALSCNQSIAKEELSTAFTEYTEFMLKSCYEQNADIHFLFFHFQITKICVYWTHSSTSYSWLKTIHRRRVRTLTVRIGDRNKALEYLLWYYSRKPIAESEKMPRFLYLSACIPKTFWIPNTFY